MKRLTYYLMKGSENDGYYLKPGVSREEAMNRLAAYENTGLDPEEVSAVKNALFAESLEAITEIDGVPIDHVRELIQAEREFRLVRMPFIAMIEQSLRDGKMKPMREQNFNGRYAVVYTDFAKWKRPLIDICGKPYDLEEAEERKEQLELKLLEGKDGECESFS